MRAKESEGAFIIQPRHVRIWGELWHALAFSLTGVGGALYGYLVFTGIFHATARPAVAFTAVALVSLGALIIFSLELTYRNVFVRYFLTNLGKCWISRGVLALFIFGILSIVGLVVDTYDASFQTLGTVSTTIAALAGLFVIVYPSLVLSSTAVPFWRSALLPLEFLVSGGLGGLAIIVLWQVLSDAGISLSPALLGLATLLVINLILHLIHLATVARSTRRETLKLLTGGELRAPFLMGFFVLGVGVPLALVIGSYMTDGFGGPLILFAAAALVLLGIFFQRYSVLRAGIKPALL